LTHHARQAQASGSARTFVVADQDDQVAGYFQPHRGSDRHGGSTSERLRQGMGRFPLPVVIMARLAVSSDHQGLGGIGVGMLQDSIRRTLLIAEQAGIRAILTHPLNENAAGFYKRFGFIPSPLRPQQLLLLLKDARKIRH
jgi:GNAT superfamily N-acetyltransferase